VAGRRRQVTVAVPRLVDPVEEDPAVRKWLTRLPDSRLIYLGQIKRFMKWLHGQDTMLPGSRECRPSDLLAWQDQAQTKEQRYAILDLLETYVNTQPAKAYKSRQLAYSAVRSFFAHNRSELPNDPHFRVHGEKPPTVGKLKAWHEKEHLMLSSTAGSWRQAFQYLCQG
jgi:hypothetical protein